MRKDYVQPLLALAEMAQTARNYKETLHYADEALKIAPADNSAKLFRATDPGDSTCTLAGGQIVFSDFTTGPAGILSNGLVGGDQPWSNTNSNHPPTSPFSEYASVLATPFSIVVGGATAYGFSTRGPMVHRFR
jgi:hypothetical protein